MFGVEMVTQEQLVLGLIADRLKHGEVAPAPLDGIFGIPRQVLLQCFIDLDVALQHFGQEFRKSDAPLLLHQVLNERNKVRLPAPDSDLGEAMLALYPDTRR
jgi:hypothetical protein